MDNNQFETKQVHEPVLDEETRKIIGGSFYSSNKLFIWAAVLAVAIIGVLVYLVFFATGGGKSEPAKVEITIDAPALIPSGGEVVYKIRLENKDTESLAAGQLELVLPDGSDYLQSTPVATNASGTLYPVPALVPAQNAVIFVKIKVNGGVGDSRNLRVKYHYRYSSVGLQFVKESDVSVQLGASDVLVEWQGPATTNNAQLVVYELKYRNNSTKEIPGGRVQVTYPDGFTPGAQNPPPDLGGNTWSVGKLSVGQEGNIQINGSYTSARGGESKNIRAEFSVLGDNGSFFVQSTASYVTQISSTPLFVSLSADNRSNSVVNPGERVNFTLQYSNNATVAARGVNISVEIDSKIIDLSSVSSDGGIVSGNTISWNASGQRPLENLAPNAQGSIRFSLRIKDPPVKDSSKNLELKLNSKISAREYSTPYPGSALNLKLGTRAAVTSSIAYVSGNIQPKVGQTTNYLVTIQLKTTTNDLADGTLTGFIPLDPKSFVNSSVTSRESGGVRFDSTTGKLIWQTNAVASGSGSFVPPRELKFTIAFTPTANMAGKSIELFKNITFTGKDAFTNEPVNLTAETLTTQDTGEGNILP